MNRNLLYAFFAIILIGIFVFLKIRKDQAQNITDTFNIEHVDEIGKVIITSKNGKSITLTKKNKEWFISDTIVAEGPLVMALMETLNNLQVEYPLSGEMRTNAINNLRLKATKVEVYDEQGDEMKTFYVGNLLDNQGNFMIQSHDGVMASDPYLVKMAGRNLDIFYRFIPNEEAWKSTLVFGTTLDKIEKISVTYPSDIKRSFVLTKDEDLIQVKPLLDSIAIPASLNKQKVINFLFAFENFRFESRVYNDSLINTFKNEPVFAEVKLTDVNGKTNEILLFKKLSAAKNIKDSRGKDFSFDLERYWGYVPEIKQYVIAQYYNLGPMLVSYSYFFDTENTSNP